MAERLVNPPALARAIVIPHEYLTICQRTTERKITRGQNKGQTVITKQADEVAAALLYFFERWTLWRIKDNSKAEQSEIWLYFSVDQIEDYEFGGAFGRHRLNAGIDLLIELGFLTRRSNPNNAWDQTYQYRFMLDTVQEAVNKLPPFSNIEQWIIQKRKIDCSKVNNRKSNIEQAIPHDPKQSPTHDPKHVPESKDSITPPPSAAGDDPADAAGNELNSPPALVIPAVPDEDGKPERVYTLQQQIFGVFKEVLGIDPDAEIMANSLIARHAKWLAGDAVPATRKADAELVPGCSPAATVDQVRVFLHDWIVEKKLTLSPQAIVFADNWYSWLPFYTPSEFPPEQVGEPVPTLEEQMRRAARVKSLIDQGRYDEAARVTIKDIRNDYATAA